ncbi:MAG: GTP-binding protein [Hyphomicrobiaceae bacterium]|nr:MAG: GTP-binding protein [Hyphomicrobiaceae bacterium]
MPISAASSCAVRRSAASMELRRRACSSASASSRPARRLPTYSRFPSTMPAPLSLRPDAGSEAMTGIEQRRGRKLPVVIITGFLGSGKTTLLNYLVKHPDWCRTAVIINEFGEVGIDHLLVETSTEQMIELNNGCICCTIRGDLADKLGSLAMWLDSGKLPPVDRVVVETTGLADPAPIMHTLMTNQNLLDRYRLDSVVTVVDAIAGLASLGRFPEAVKQIAVADRLIVSKQDLVGKHSARETFDDLLQRLHRLNPRAAIYQSDRGRVDPALLRSHEGGDADAALADFAVWLQSAEKACGDASCNDPNDHHRDGIASFVVRFGKVRDVEGFNQFLQELVIELGEHILRIKGILDVAGKPDTPAVIHGVQHVLFPVSWLRRWQDCDRGSKLVFITHNLDPRGIQARFAQHFAPASGAGPKLERASHG